ncbi:MAG: (2Fe-2S)-binding protein [Candidatus Bipolaricaulota bacterium]|nr:(2Fe-2S)-binding protein [Candidatus Bipolaricaulota bacterium]
MRIKDHPILGVLPEARWVKIRVDDREITAIEGEPVAAAVSAAGIRVHRYTAKRGEPRGVFCGIGQCTDCMMRVNGVPNVRTCITPVVEGMVVETQLEAEPKEFS